MPKATGVSRAFAIANATKRWVFSFTLWHGLLEGSQSTATPFLVEKCVDTLCALADDAQAKPKSSEAPNQEHEMKQELAADSLSLANVEFPSPTSEEKAPEEKQDDSLLLSTPKQRQVLQREETSSDPHHRRSVSPDFFENFEPTLSSSQISIDPDYTLAVDSIHIGVSKEPENDEPEEQDDLANLASEDVPCSEFDFESVASIETDYTPIPAEASGKHSETSSTDEGTGSESLEPRFRIAKPQKPSERIIQKAKALYKAALERQRETKQLKFEAYRTFFRAHNRRYDPSKRTGLACIDLHGQKVESALRILELHLINCGIKNVYQTVIITGRGLHSKGGIPRLKPAIIEVLEGRSDLRFHMTNPGRINVIFLQHKPSSDEKEE